MLDALLESEDMVASTEMGREGATWSGSIDTPEEEEEVRGEKAAKTGEP